MRTLLFLLFPFCLLAQQKVKLELKQQHEYCGGARPTPEILEKYEKPWPFSNQKLIIISSKGKVDSVITSQEGVFETKLKDGTYKVYEAWKYHKLTPNGEPIENFDKECLKKIWAMPCVSIKIKGKSVQTNVKIDTAYCQHKMPCLKNPQMPE